MALTLTADITASARTLTVTGTVPAEVEPGYRFRLDDELLYLAGFGLQEVQYPDRTQLDIYRNEWRVRRAQGGTVAASHSTGATIKAVLPALVAAADDDPPPDPFAAGGEPTADAHISDASAAHAATAIAFTPAGTIAATTVQAAIEEVAGEAGGGGATPGAVRWLGPCKIGAFDGVYLFGYVGAAGGTYTLTVNGQTTAAIDFDATHAEIQAALEALASIGAGNVVVSGDATTLNDGYVNVVFRDARATDMLTGDGTNLTGAGAPYSLGMEGSLQWAVEMFTPAVGDIIEDFMHTVVTAFDPDDGPRLVYTDSLTLVDNGAEPAWSMPISAQGIDGLDISLVDNSFTNFSGNTEGATVEGAQSRPTALTALIAQWSASASGASVNLYSNLPAMVKNAVPVYAFVHDVLAAPTAGEVWVWVKVATPAALD